VGRMERRRDYPSHASKLELGRAGRRARTERGAEAGGRGPGAIAQRPGGELPRPGGVRRSRRKAKLGRRCGVGGGRALVAILGRRPDARPLAAKDDGDVRRGQSAPRCGGLGTVELGAIVLTVTVDVGADRQRPRGRDVRRRQQEERDQPQTTAYVANEAKHGRFGVYTPPVVRPGMRPLAEQPCTVPLRRPSSAHPGFGIGGTIEGRRA